MNRYIPLLTAIIFSIGGLPQVFAQKSKVTSTVKTSPAKKKGNSKIKLSVRTPKGSTQAIKGKWEGKPCHGGTSQTTEDVSVECSVGDQKATCNCKANCTNTCVGITSSSPGTFSTDCTIDMSSCSVQATGGAGLTGVGAGSKAPQ